jgi:hypothetical protein
MVPSSGREFIIPASDVLDSATVTGYNGLKDVIGYARGHGPEGGAKPVEMRPSTAPPRPAPVLTSVAQRESGKPDVPTVPQGGSPTCCGKLR